ncbi:MAG: gliding motility-associated C-terminal domain-containing protein, partial [Lutimonas sp.]
NWQSGTTFAGLIPGDYTVIVRSTVDTTCETSSVSPVTIDAVPTAPIITNIIATDPTVASCPILNNGSIVIDATGSDLEYSIDNGVTYQSSNIFNGLIAGAYEVVIRNTVTSCITTNNVPVVLTAPSCIAELLVTKEQTGGPATVTVVGEVLDYTITLVNNGTLSLTNISIQDVLPNGNNGVLVGPSGDNGIANVMEAGETWVYTISYTVELNDFVKGTDVINTVTVDADELTDPVTDNAITLISSADLELTMSVDNSNPQVGASVVFSLELTNNGPSDANGVIVSDLLPSGYSYVSDNSGGNYNAANGLWNIGNVSSGSNSTIQITATVNPTGNYENIAEVSASDLVDPDSTPANNNPSEDDWASVTTAPTAVSDIELTMVVDNNSPNVGSNVVYTITVQNNGLSESTGVTVQDLLPDGLTYVGDDGSGAYNESTGIWTLPTIPSGSSFTINITANVNVTGNYTNIAEVATADQLDPDSTPGNGNSSEDDYAEITLDAQAVSDLELIMTVDNNNPFVGESVIFTLSVNNNGPSDASGINVASLLPSGFTYVSDNAAGNYNGVTGAWTIGNLASSAMTEIQIVALVNAIGNYENQAEIVSSDNFDPDSTPGNGVVTEDDFASILVEPVPVSDLSLTQMVSDANPTTGDTITYTITVQNDGPSDATGVSVIDRIPSGFGNISAISNGGNLSGNDLTWNGITIPAGSSVILTFSAEVLTTGTYVNETEITASDILDPNSDPNASFDVDDLNDGLVDNDESRFEDITINYLPIAINDDVIVVENVTDHRIDVLLDNGNGADDFGGDGPSTNAIVLTTLPSNGTATIEDNGTPNDPTDDYVLYTPNANFVGIDSFTYTIEDGQGLIGSSEGDKSTATVSIEVIVDTDGDLVGDIYDIDDDNDGILDTVEGLSDFDSDSYPNSLDIDADNDGIPDNIEAQSTTGYIRPSGNDADRNGLDDSYESTPGAGEGISVVNSDNDIDPDYVDQDSDNDRVPDNLEGHDYNHDSMADVLPTGTDSDQDGLDDGYEGADMNDGFVVNGIINNPLTDLPNTDKDNEVDYRDTDDDNDGIATIDEDLDGNGNPIDDDTDGDLVANYLDIDDDNDGILTLVEGTDDVDNDSRPNYLDIDADGDGIPDNIEAQNTLEYILPSLIDSDNNGLDDAYESSPGSGTGIQAVDTDKDGDIDMFDLDSDNDNVPDATEGHDYDHNGLADTSPSNSDQDNDGLDDGYEGSDRNDGFIPNDEIFNPLTDLPNRDDADDVDYRDIDDDNDGINTVEEDSNEDGDPTNDNCDEDYWPNYLDETPCNIVPNGFSPNGDGVNDTLVVPALSEYPDFKMEIYDRWGGKVWEYQRKGQATPTWWDGYSQNSLTLNKGELMPAGTYFYVIEFNKNNRKRETGWVYLNK